MWDGIHRRRGDKMKDGFEPSTPFEGYVAAKLETMAQRLDDLPCGETFKRLNKCENDISNMKGKATVIGAVFGFIAGLIGKYLWGK
jgi:hypothetical protein